MQSGQGRGQGSGQGGGMGRGGGRGGGQGGGMGKGGGRGGGGFGLGPDGECMCTNCGYRTPHQIGTPCYNLSCPKCGAMMTRAM